MGPADPAQGPSGRAVAPVVTLTWLRVSSGPPQTRTWRQGRGLGFGRGWGGAPPASQVGGGAAACPEASPCTPTDTAPRPPAHGRSPSSASVWPRTPAPTGHPLHRGGPQYIIRTRCLASPDPLLWGPCLEGSGPDTLTPPPPTQPQRHRGPSGPWASPSIQPHQPHTQGTGLPLAAPPPRTCVTPQPSAPRLR